MVNASEERMREEASGPRSKHLSEREEGKELVYVQQNVRYICSYSAHSDHVVYDV
jgi:hypothetical protein